MAFVVQKNHEKIFKYLPEILKWTDENRKSFGFLPKSVYEEQLNLGKLWVVTKVPGGEFSGHLLFGSKFPKLKVYQLFVHPLERKKNIGKLLISQLIDYGVKHGYDTIYARVAKDLEANLFWEKNNFKIVSVLKNNNISSREIFVRMRYLQTPPLLRLMCEEIEASSENHDYFYSSPLLKRKIFVLDINVVFDLVRKRAHEKEISTLLKAGLNHEARIMVTPEFEKELMRHSQSIKNDPFLEFIKNLPTLSPVKEDLLESFGNTVRQIIFPDRSKNRVGKERDISDSRHLVYSIYNNANFFVTREKAILKAAEKIRDDFGVFIISPNEFINVGQIFGKDKKVRHVGEEIEILNLKENYFDAAKDFLFGNGLSKREIDLVLDKDHGGGRRNLLFAKKNETVFAVACWEKQSYFQNTINLFICLDESCKFAEAIVDHIFETVFRDSTCPSVRKITLHAPPNQDIVIELAMTRGFKRNVRSAGNELIKISKSGMVHKKSWGQFRKEIENLIDWLLPEKIPKLLEINERGIKIDTPEGSFVQSLFDLESNFSPVQILFPGRSGVLVPIKKSYSDELFGLTQQLRIFPGPEALIRVEKAYYRTWRNGKIFKRGMPVVFYESGAGKGSKELIGVARITSSSIVNVDEIGSRFYRQGVLSKRELKSIADSKTGILQVITFDNFNAFRKNIPFKDIQEISPRIKTTNIQTAQLISEQELEEILLRGFNCK